MSDHMDKLELEIRQDEILARQQSSEGVVENPKGDYRELYTCRKCGGSHWYGEVRACEGVVVELKRHPMGCYFYISEYPAAWILEEGKHRLIGPIPEGSE